MNVFAGFDGHSGGRTALHVMGITPTKYYASEVDKYAMQASAAVFPDIIQMGDITKWREWDINWSTIDLFIGGSPCQGFSMAGKMAGTAAMLNGEKVVVDTREKYLELKEAGAEFLSQSYLFWEYILLLDHVKLVNPKVKFFLENVKMKKEFLDLISNAIGVEPVFINSALASAQNRQRYYWCNWDVTQPEDKGIVLADILEGGEACDLMTTKQDKSFVLTASYNGAVAWNSIERKQRTMIKEYGISETCVNKFKRYGVKFITPQTLKGKVLTAGDYGKLGKYGNYLEVKGAAKRGRYDDNGKIVQQFEVRKDDKTNSLTTVQKDNFVMQRVATATDIKGHDALKRIYAKEGKAPTLTTMQGGHQEPKVLIQESAQECIRNVHYRKLTPRECGRLQTIPEDIIDTLLSAGISNSQLYKMFGNGWTIDVIVHIFSQADLHTNKILY